VLCYGRQTTFAFISRLQRRLEASGHIVASKDRKGSSDDKIEPRIDFGGNGWRRHVLTIQPYIEGGNQFFSQPAHSDQLSR
jgi:hypothetical protein